MSPLEISRPQPFVDCYYDTDRSLVVCGENMDVCKGSIDECGSRTRTGRTRRNC